MAFLLARLQKEYWDERAAWVTAPIGGATSYAGSGDSREAIENCTPNKKRSRETAEDEVGQHPPKEPMPKRIVQEQSQASKKIPQIGADMLAGSVRLQQILAARRKQEQEQAQRQEQKAA